MKVCLQKESRCLPLDFHSHGRKPKMLQIHFRPNIRCLAFFYTNCWHPLLFCWRRSLYTKWVISSRSRCRSIFFRVEQVFSTSSSGSLPVWRLWLGSETITINCHSDGRRWRLIRSVPTAERVQFDPRNPSVCQNLRAVFTLHTKTLMHPAYGQNVILSTFCSHFILFFGRRRAVTSCMVQKVIFVARETAERSANSWIRFEKSLISSDKQRWTPAPLLLYI